MSQNLIYAISGGALIGLSGAILLFLNGRILGVSGIIGGLFGSGLTDRFWRLFFILGVLLGGYFIEPLGFTVMSLDTGVSQLSMAVGGFLVGFGTLLGKGCTSGHGICGVSRLSKRSLAATVLFMLAGFVTIHLVQSYGGSF